MFFRHSHIVALAAVTALSFSCIARSDSKPAMSKGPSQAQLAHQGAFPSVSAGDASVKGAIAATNLTKAKSKLNSSAMFVGVVTDIYLPKNGKRVLLDFASDYKKAVIGLIDVKNFKTFPNLLQLKKKKVLLSGKVISYKGQLQVELTSASAIKIVK